MKYAVVDVETTGLFPGGHDRIVEVAILTLDSAGRISAEYDTLLNPERDMGPTWLHGIETRDVLHAPLFRDVAGDISVRLNGAIIVGHNVSFDIRFLRSEFARLGVLAPQPAVVDTLPLAVMMGSPHRKLEDACAHFGITLADSHSALGDATSTAALFARGLEHVGPDRMRGEVVGHPRDEREWPAFAALRQPLSRSAEAISRRKEDSFLASLVRRLPAEGNGDWQQYYAILDRALEDRRLSSLEETALRQVALESGLAANDVRSANKAYLWGVIEVALRDGALSEMERSDIEDVANLLGLGHLVGDLLASAHNVSPHEQPAETSSTVPLDGKSVCFTGALNASIAGRRATRGLATERATAMGMLVVKTVTKKLDYLVVADPDSLSGKARKARAYGTRILAETVFWQLVGVDTD